MSKIYIVMVVWRYEGCAPLRAFVNREHADQFAARCTAYERGPSAPDMDDPQDQWDAWDAKVAAWRDGHPAGDDGWSGDSFTVTEMKLETEPA